MQAGRSGKRKARSEEEEQGTAASTVSGQSRKVVKRTQGLTPSRKGPAPGLRGQSPAQKGPGPSPLRHLNGARGAQGPSRLANSTHISDIENADKAANSSEQVLFHYFALLYCAVHISLHWLEVAVCPLMTPASPPGLSGHHASCVTLRSLPCPIPLSPMLHFTCVSVAL